MSETFSTLIARSQRAIDTILESQDYNPVSVICGEVADIASNLSISDLLELATERPEILTYKPTDFDHKGQGPSGADIIRACVQIEVENGIDMTPFSAAVNKWFTHIHQTPEHLIAKMQAIVQATENSLNQRA